MDQISDKIVSDATEQQVDDIVKDEPIDEANDTLNALEAIPDVIEKLDEDNTQYDLHVRLIQLLRRAELYDQLEQARINMHAIYPMSEALWLEWIQDAKKEADIVEGKKKLFQLYDLAQEDYVSITIWKDYTEYILENFYEDFTDNITTLDESVEDWIDHTRQDLLKAVRASSNHVKQSQEIWKLYSEFELAVLGRFNEDEYQLSRTKKMYLDRLAVLHIDCEDTFNSYSQFVTQYSNTNYEESMLEANKIYAKTKAAAEERDYYELQLTSTGYALDTFYQYIEYELTTKNMFALNHVRSLYERAIIYYCTDPSLWDDYILFLIERARIQAYLETTCKRAVRNCPWSGVLWAHLARAFESGQKSVEQVQNIFDRALASKPILSSIEDLVTVLLAKCDHARRRIDWEDLDEDAVMDLKVAFEESLEYIAEAFPESGDPYYRIEKYYAYISLKRFDDAEKARELWEDVVERQGLNTEAWIQLILFERDQENYERCATLFKQAIQKKIDNPARLIDVWNTIEHEVGTLASFEESLVRINRKTKQLSRQWQSQYTQEKEEKSKEKKTMDRKKKSQHRIAQKQRAREKKNQSDFKAPIQKALQSQHHQKPVEKEEPVFAADYESTKEDISTEVASKEPNPLKRKLSAENEQEAKKVKSGPKEEQEEAKQDKPKSTAAFMPRPRSARPHTAIRRGKALKLGQRSVNRNDADKLMTESDKKEEPETSKSNDDFRAMLLGKK